MKVAIVDRWEADLKVAIDIFYNIFAFQTVRLVVKFL